MNDIKQVGKVFHELRTNHNISLKQVADDTVSVSQLSRFERGETDLSISKFLTALDNMSIEMNEFMDLLKNHQQSETIEFMRQLTPLEYERDIQGFQRLFHEQERKYKQNPSVYQYHLNSILAQSFICKCYSKIPFPKEYINEVADYLFMVEKWNIYELILIGNLYLFFDIPLVDKMGKEILKQTLNTNANLKLATITLLNIYETCVYRNALEVAQYYKDQLPQLMQDETWLYERNIYYFLSGLYLYKTGEQRKGNEMMKHAIQIYEWLKCDNLAKNYQQDKNQQAK